MNHETTPRFWNCYGRLPKSTQKQADEKFELLKQNPRHPSLHLKQIGEYWSVRIGLYYRALGINNPSKDGIISPITSIEMVSMLSFITS